MNVVSIIDDEEIDCLIHSTIIRKGGFSEKIITQNSGRLALEYLQSILNNNIEWPTHILIDINMPHLNRFGFLDAYLKIPDIHLRKTKIYVVSSSTNFNDIHKAKEYKILADYITKSFTVEMAEKVFNS